MTSRTQRALHLVAQGITAYAAAKQVGIHPSNLYRAQKNQRAKTCPHCGFASKDFVAVIGCKKP